MENTGYSLSDIAAASGSEGFGGNSLWIIVLFLFALMGGGFGGFNTGNAARTEDIQRAVDLNSIQTGQANIAADIQRGIYEINGATKDAAYNNLSEIRDTQSAINAGNSNIVNNLTALQSNMQNCCCETKSMIMENRYLAEKNASDVMMNNTQNTQKILDAISTNRIADMQNQINALQLQNAVSGVVKYPQATTYAVASPCFNTGCGCNNI